MSEVLLQVWGGVFFLLNKIFFSRVERSLSSETEKFWRISSWSVYLIGLPAWIILFILNRNWIAAALEAGGAPSMVLGIIIAVRGKGKEPRLLNLAALVGVVVGLAYSLYDFSGLTTIRQFLELGIVAGYLVGTYLLAKKIPSGYLWYLPMIASCAALMWVEAYPWLLVQQIVSLYFVIDAWVIERRKRK